MDRHIVSGRNCSKCWTFKCKLDNKAPMWETFCNYREEDFIFGFICTHNDKAKPFPKYVVCLEQVCNESMKPTFLIIYLEAIHENMAVIPNKAKLRGIKSAADEIQAYSTGQRFS